MERTDLLVCDELGYLSFSRAVAESLFQVFADRYERRSLLSTSVIGRFKTGHLGALQNRPGK